MDKRRESGHRYAMDIQNGVEGVAMGTATTIVKAPASGLLLHVGLNSSRETSR